MTGESRKYKQRIENEGPTQKKREGHVKVMHTSTEEDGQISKTKERVEVK